MAGVTSQDFASGMPGTYDVHDPASDGGSSSVTGGQLVISVPSGSSHDTWQNVNSAVGRKEACGDVEFDHEVFGDGGLSPNESWDFLCFDSAAAGEDSTPTTGRCIRVGKYKPSTLPERLFVAEITFGTSPTIHFNAEISATDIRIVREDVGGGDFDYTIYTDATERASFTSDLVLSHVVYTAGNFTTNPANTYAFDEVINALESSDLELTADPPTRGTRSGLSASVATQSALSLSAGAPTRGARGFTASLSAESASSLATDSITRGTREFSASLASESALELSTDSPTRGARGFSASVAAESAQELTTDQPTRGTRSGFSASLAIGEQTLSTDAPTRGVRGGFSAVLANQSPVELASDAPTRGTRSFSATVESQPASELAAGVPTRGTRSFAASLSIVANTLAADSPTRGARQFAASFALQSALSLSADAPTRGARSFSGASLAVGSPLPLSAGVITRGARSFAATLTISTGAAKTYVVTRAVESGLKVNPDAIIESSLSVSSATESGLKVQRSLVTET